MTPTFSLSESIPTELKSTIGTGNIIKYADKAFKKQGAECVLFKFREENGKVDQALYEIKRKYNKRILFYSEKDNRIKEIK